MNHKDEGPTSFLGQKEQAAEQEFRAQHVIQQCELGDDVEGAI